MSKYKKFFTFLITIVLLITLPLAVSAVNARGVSGANINDIHILNIDIDEGEGNIEEDQGKKPWEIAKDTLEAEKDAIEVLKEQLEEEMDELKEQYEQAKDSGDIELMEDLLNQITELEKQKAAYKAEMKQLIEQMKLCF